MARDWCMIHLCFKINVNREERIVSKIAKSLLVAGAIMGVNSANAMMNFEEVSPYFGADYEWSHMKGAGASQLNMHEHVQSLNRFYPKSYSGANIYLGGRWCDWGIEVGYDVTGRKTRRQRVPVSRISGPADQFEVFGAPTFGALVPGDTLSVRVKQTGWHLDFNGYLPLCDCWELIGTVGLGWVKPKLSITGTHLPANVITPGVLNDSLRLSTKYRGMFRLGAGVQYMVTECIGFRGLIRWKNTDKLRVNLRNAAPAAARSIPSFQQLTLSLIHI